MRRWIVITSVILFAIVVATVPVLAFQKIAEGKAQTHCPVMGGKIDKSIYADYEGKRVYFCCPQCRQEFLKNPKKWMKKLEDDGVTLEKTPET